MSVHWHGAGTKFRSATVKHKGSEEQTGKIGLHTIIRNCDIWFEENAFQVQEKKVTLYLLRIWVSKYRGILYPQEEKYKAGADISI